jgi:NAD-dependent deacetylase
LTDGIAAIAALIRARLGPDGRLTVLTGAGISAESGVPTFRDMGGLWERYRVEEVASPDAFRRDPELVYRFYNLRRAALNDTEPNAGHRALVQLEAHLADRFALITQNVDDLHERAGSRRMVHMHGELRKARCLACGEVCAWLGSLDASSCCPVCKTYALRPHIVWFGEMPLHMDVEIPRYLQADVFLSVGTSGRVYPAAGFVADARAAGALAVEVNLEAGDMAPVFDRRLYGRAGEVLPPLVAALTGG